MMKYKWVIDALRRGIKLDFSILHLGEETSVSQGRMVGIFDLDTTTVNRVTRDYLSAAEKRGQVVAVSAELPKSFVVCAPQNQGEQTVYLSPLSSVTLQKRCVSPFY